MNSVAFLAMLISFAVVMSWYAWSYERGTDGKGGVLGIRTGGDDEDEVVKERGHALRNVRAGHTDAATTLQRVRERAEATRAGERPKLRARTGAEDRGADPDRRGP